MDCTSKGGEYDNLGCEGGYMESTWRFAKENRVFPAQVFPYKAKNDMCISDGQVINKDVIKTGVILNQIKDIGTSPAELKKALEDGPVVATIRAGNPVFRHYSKGVIDSQDCHTKYEKYTQYDHAVLIVGHGTAVKGGNYFVIKNSWSSNWGSKGFAKISADVLHDPNGVCGIMTSLKQPVVKKR